MSDMLLKTLDIKNFRSIRGHIHVPLDAQVVLIHGENGAGKTSLLSAIELALTGKVLSLQRADPDYSRQLLHRSAEDGIVAVRAEVTGVEKSFHALITDAGADSITALSDDLSSFFSERSYLPQSLLGQLLQIYQDSGSGIDSPLAQFVGDLLGLDRLDALEAGLKPLVDVRNVRKVVEHWSGAEIEKSRLERLLMDQNQSRLQSAEVVKAAREKLVVSLQILALSTEFAEEHLDEMENVLGEPADSEALDWWNDQLRRLGAIRREYSQMKLANQQARAPESPLATDIADAYNQWEAANGPTVSALRQQVMTLLPQMSLPTDHGQFSEEALKQLSVARDQASARAESARVDIERLTKANDELNIAQRQLASIDIEMGQISDRSETLGSALAEIAAFISDDTCPVCDRNFAEVEQGALSDHVHAKVRSLSASADRLLTIGNSRSGLQLQVERLQRETAALNERVVDIKILADMDRTVARLVETIAKIENLSGSLAEGDRLRAASVAATRATNEREARSVSLSAAHETLNDFAVLIGAPGVVEQEALDDAGGRMAQFLQGKIDDLEKRYAARRSGIEAVQTMRLAISDRVRIEQAISTLYKQLQQKETELEFAQVVRDQGMAVRNAVDDIRSKIIRREFNDRLNRLWRDLFVRLAPGEPFIPAFRIPTASTQRLQPKLITEHRDGGDAGGTPGAMLSAGNLNTAALTLFTALHLSVPNKLPWLILDDPVQSMDDVHIAHFAALLRTLSKEHGRQIMIAVHDRQLFEYLRLELSPAFVGDSLLTLELSRGPHRDTHCLPKRLNFQIEKSLLAAA